MGTSKDYRKIKDSLEAIDAILHGIIDGDDVEKSDLIALKRALSKPNIIKVIEDALLTETERESLNFRLQAISTFLPLVSEIGQQFLSQGDMRDMIREIIQNAMAEHGFDGHAEILNLKDFMGGKKLDTDD